MSASRARTLLCAPRRIVWSVRNSNYRSTWLVDEDPVGVKCIFTRGVPGEPGLDRGNLVRAVVVADQVDARALGHRLVDGGQELPELGGAVLAVDSPRTVPSVTLNAANRVVMPCRA